MSNVAKGKGWTQDDWYAAGESQIHFFPMPKRLLWTVGKKIMLDVEAWGGQKAVRHHHYRYDPIDQGMRPRLTTPGGYVISGWGPYRTDTWKYSRIRWGTPLRIDLTGQYVLFETGNQSDRWKRVDSVIPGMTRASITDFFRELWGYDRSRDTDGDGVPDTWVFNDFGPVAINYFRDPNRNRKLDKGERIMGEMIHTTPVNEAQTSHGEAVTMEFSHGCIHVRPVDLGRLIGQGAVKAGNLLFVHGPGEIVFDELSP